MHHNSIKQVLKLSTGHTVCVIWGHFAMYRTCPEHSQLIRYMTYNCFNPVLQKNYSTSLIPKSLQSKSWLSSLTISPNFPPHIDGCQYYWLCYCRQTYSDSYIWFTYFVSFSMSETNSNKIMQISIQCKRNGWYINQKGIINWKRSIVFEQGK